MTEEDIQWMFPCSSDFGKYLSCIFEIKKKVIVQQFLKHGTFKNYKTNQTEDTAWSQSPVLVRSEFIYPVVFFF